ncbi:MAG: hypothetical protein ACRDHV_00825 [Actinomycetota bacterium]
MGLRSSVLVVALVAFAFTAAPVTLPRGAEGDLQAPTCSGAAPPPPSARDVAALDREPVLANSWIQRSDTNQLSWVDPVTLRPVSDRVVPLGNQNGAPHVFSPDGSQLAIGALSRLQLVDLEGMKRLWSLPLAGRALVAGAWFRDDLLTTVLIENGEPWRMSLVHLDPLAGDEVERIPLEGAPVGAGRLADLLVLLLQPPYSAVGLAPATLVTIDRDGRVRQTTLELISAGFDPQGEDPDDDVGFQVTPGLAVDPDGRRAFVVGAGEPVAEVDLDDLEVEYHWPAEDRALFAGLLPAAEAKIADHRLRRAVWLGDGLLAVSGHDWEITGIGRDGKEFGRPAGVTIIDTRTWTKCALTRGMSLIAEAGGLLLAHNSFLGTCDQKGNGVAAYGRDGAKRWHLLEEEWVDLQVAGPYAYAATSCARWRVSVIDLVSGEVINENGRRPPAILSP